MAGDRRQGGPRKGRAVRQTVEVMFGSTTTVKPYNNRGSVGGASQGQRGGVGGEIRVGEMGVGEIRVGDCDDVSHDGKFIEHGWR